MATDFLHKGNSFEEIVVQMKRIKADSIRIIQLEILDEIDQFLKGFHSEKNEVIDRRQRGPAILFGFPDLAIGQ